MQFGHSTGLGNIIIGSPVARIPACISLLSLSLSSLLLESRAKPTDAAAAVGKREKGKEGLESSPSSSSSNYTMRRENCK